MNDRQRARREERQRRREEYQKENEKNKDNRTYGSIFGRTYSAAKWWVIRLALIHYLKKFWELIKERVNRGG